LSCSTNTLTSRAVALPILAQAFSVSSEDAMAGRFDCVLVCHSSRFPRNTIEAKQYKRLLRRELGIDVISVTQPLGGDADDPAAFLTE